MTATSSPSGPETDRFARMRLVEGWDPALLAAGTVVVAGVGALGNEVAKNLALAGVGRMILCDPDTVSITNLSRTVLFSTGDVGRPKPDAAAGALRVLAPDTVVDTRPTDLVSGVGLGELADAAVVLGCLDSIRARVQLLGRATLVNAALIDGGTGPWAGEVRVRMSPDEPCFACSLTQHERGVTDVPWSCAEPRQGGPVAASILSTALVAAWMSAAAVRVMLGYPPDYRLLRIDALTGRTEPVRLTRDPDCPTHVPLAESPAPIAVDHRDTVGALLAALPAGAQPTVWARFPVPLPCLVCGNDTHLSDDFPPDGWCVACGAVLRSRYTEQLRDAPPHMRLCDLGVAPEEILTVRTAEGGHLWFRLK